MVLTNPGCVMVKGMRFWWIGFSGWSLGINYPGGWVPGNTHSECVDICKLHDDLFPSSHYEEVGLEDATYDYLLLEQLYIPQYCRDLLLGIDYTISHRPVLPFPEGIRCNVNAVVNELSIHGLWPSNYDGSYLSCCKLSKKLENRPIEPKPFNSTNYNLLQKMKTQWVDPTQPTAFEALCELYNHEFQKHGSCFAAGIETVLDVNELSALYFNFTIQAVLYVSSASEYIRNLVDASTNASISLKNLSAIYPKKIQVFCSNTYPDHQRLAAIRTCYARPNILGMGTSDVQIIDCPEASFGGSYSSCDAAKPISLLEYFPTRSNLTDYIL